MSEKLTISDAHLIKLSFKENGLTILKESDHLLRRFGQVDLINMDHEDQFEIKREVADEIWAVVAGGAKFELEDQREQSPTRGAVDIIEMDGKSPTALLVPFGVAYKIQCLDGGLLVRISTHEDGTHPEDQTV